MPIIFLIKKMQHLVRELTD